MKAGATSVLKLLQGSKLFVIPSFQRRYSWRAKEWEQLWNDLVRESKTPHSDDPQVLDGHFLGSVVLHPAAGPASTLMRHLVIDGQQRLTTIIILLAVLRDVRSALDPKWDANKYDKQYLSNPYEDGYQERLLPTRLDRVAYVRTVRERQPTEGMGQAYTYFEKRVRSAALAGTVDLATIGDTLLLHMLLVEINTKPGDSVNNIFNTLNSKGLPLSAADLVRNELMLHVGEQGSEELHENYWLPIERALVKVTPKKFEDREFVTFLWSREVVDDPSTTRQELFSAFELRLRRELANKNADERQAMAVNAFHEIYEDHLLFQIVRSPRTAASGSTRLGADLLAALDRLARWGSEPTTPLALWLVKGVANGSIESNDAIGAVEILLSYLMRRTLNGIPTNTLNRLLTSVPHDLARRVSSSSVSEALGNILRKKGYYWPSDAEVLGAVESLPILATARRHVGFLLREVEVLLPGMERADAEGTQLEHIMPQTLSSEWLNYLQQNGVELDEALSLVNALGNLTLTDNNQSMGNSPFSEKRDNYFSGSSLRLNRDLSTYEEFLPEDIRARGRKMALLLLERYPGPETPSDLDRVSSREDSGSSLADRLEAALQAMPEASWTTESDLVVYLGATLEDVRDAVNNLDAVLARLVLNDDMSLPSWFNEPLREMTSTQLSAQVGRREDDEALRRLVAAVEEPDEEVSDDEE